MERIWRVFQCDSGWLEGYAVLQVDRERSEAMQAVTNLMMTAMLVVDN